MRYGLRFSILPSAMGYLVYLVYYPTRYVSRFTKYGFPTRSWRPFQHPGRLGAANSAGSDIEDYVWHGTIRRFVYWSC